MTKIVHDTDIGSGLEISGGKLNAAPTMATDNEVADAIAAADVAENAAEALVKSRSEFLKRAQQVLSSEAVWEVSAAGIKFSLDPAATQSRIMVMGAGEGSNSLSSGYLDIMPPAAGTVVKGLGIADVVVDSNGYIPLNAYTVIYYKLPPANSSPAAVGEWMHTLYAGADYDVPEDCVFIAQLLRNSSYERRVQLYDGRILHIGKNYQDTNWVDISSSFVSGATNYGQGHQTLRVRRSGNRVYLEGLVSIAASYTGALFSLPAGFIPTLHHIFSGNINDGTSRVDVSPTGVVSLINHQSAHPWVSLAGINFGLD